MSKQNFESIMEPWIARVADAGYPCCVLSFDGDSLALNGTAPLMSVPHNKIHFGLGAMMARFADPGEDLTDALNAILHGYELQRAALMETPNA